MLPALHRQQRLFTGSLFPEVLNAQLYDFAVRHRLQSNVWVPHKAFDCALKPYHICILPSAVLCDVTLTLGGGVAEVTESIGADRVLVNAQHTSNQALLERFREFMMSQLTIPMPPTERELAVVNLYVPTGAAVSPRHQSSESPVTRAAGAGRPLEMEFFSAADAPANAMPSDVTAPPARMTGGGPPPIVLQPEPSWDQLPPFQFPLLLNSSLLSSTDKADQLRGEQQKGHYFSNYWQRKRNASTRQPWFLPASRTATPGRFNPFFCVRYVPYNSTGRPFPSDIQRQMKHRAVAYGYVSRMWLTRQQGETLFGTTLLPERAGDYPPVRSGYHTGGLETLTYYCADQFARADEVFPTRNELDLMSKGVWLSLSKTVAYPLLHALQTRHATETAKTAQERRGIDVSMQDMHRHSAFSRLVATYHTVRLVGFERPHSTVRHLRTTLLHLLLHSACILRGYPTPCFISHRLLLQFGLRLRAGEEGVTQTRAPVPLSDLNAFTSGECWFNVAQLEEPAVAAELLDNWPWHFTTRRRLRGVIASHCCRVQVRRRQEASDRAVPSSLACAWVPLYVAGLAGWKVRPGAGMIPYTSASGEKGFRRFAVGHNVLVQMRDVELDSDVMEWITRYTPVDAKGRPYLRGARQALLLRAYERGYRSPVWVRLPSSPKLEHALKLRPVMKPVAPGVQPLPTTAALFGTEPFVYYGNHWFVNEEELDSPLSPHSKSSSAAQEGQTAAAASGRLDEDAQFCASRGIGVSAETLDLPSAGVPRFPMYDADGDEASGDAEDDAMGDGGDGEGDDDVAQTALDDIEGSAAELLYHDEN